MAITRTKSELIDELAIKANISNNEAEVVINTTFEAISQALKKGHRSRNPWHWFLCES